MTTFAGLVEPLSGRFKTFWYGIGMNSDWAQCRYNEMRQLVRSRLETHPANHGDSVILIDDCMVTITPTCVSFDIMD